MKQGSPIQDTFMIPLTRDQVALVEERDFYRLRKHKWHARWNPHTKSFYAAHTWHRKGEGRGAVSSELMHRRIMGAGDWRLQVDHVNHNTLDNRQQNLRLVNNRGNHENRRDQGEYGPGVRLERRKRLRRPFQAQVAIGRKQHHLGMFATAEDATEARRKFLEERGLR